MAIPSCRPRHPPPDTMLGTYRLILAIAVALSHIGYRIGGLNPGVIAVVGFYLVSGYVMAGLLQRRYPSIKQAPGFYLDRAARLLPQYLFYAALTLVWFIAIAPQHTNLSLDYHLSRLPTYIDAFNNLTIVPLNYYMWNASDRFTLLPPAWSLGAEIQFYLLTPLILCIPRCYLPVGLIALTTYALAVFGKINSDWFGYRLLPGVLIFFLLGAALQTLHQQQRLITARWLVGISLLVVLLLGWLAGQHGSLHQPYNRETLLGLALALPILHILARQPRSTWDDTAGDISYGVFLNHFLLYWAIFPSGVSLSRLPIFILSSMLLAWLTQRLLERPCLAWRKSKRK